MTGRARFSVSLDPVTACILIACLAVEAMLQLSDLDIIDAPRLRQTVYEYAGFWPGLLRDWRPNYAAQPALMFFTYGFLHGGVFHFVVNMLTLLSLGRATWDRVGTARYAAIYGISILGGAVGYAVLSTVPIPMVGASGALFGLAGAIVAWEARDRLALGEPLGPVVRLVGFLVVLNLVLWWAMDGHLAWQTHLGGFVAGALAAIPFDRSDPQRA
ncbi:MAG: rhomboid family intramembrane serine protease [Pseudomonadota bacterium]